MQPDTLKRLFREQLKAFRLAAGLSQTDLAKKIKAHQPYVAALESGDRSPTLETIAKLAVALGVSPRELIPE